MPSQEAVSIDTVEFIEAHGRRIMLVVNYNHTPETIIAAIDHLAAELHKEPDHSLRVVLDVAGGSANYKGTAYWESQLELYDSKAIKAAVVSTGMKRLVTSAIVTAAHLMGLGFAQRVKIFDDRQKAIDWVAQD